MSGSSKMRQCIDRVDLGVSSADPVFPGIEQNLASNCRLAEHRQARRMAVERFEQLDHHPFRYVEITLSSQRSQARVHLEVRFLGQIGAPEHTKVGSGKSRNTVLQSKSKKLWQTTLSLPAKGRVQSVELSLLTCSGLMSTP